MLPFTFVRLLAGACLLVATRAFVLSPQPPVARPSRTTPVRILTLSARRSNGDDTEDALSDNNDIGGLPLLTSFGSSSLSLFDNFDGTLPHLQPPPEGDGTHEPKMQVVARKFELQYTCKVCETRNCHKVSRTAYNKGVVIATCQGCTSQHLIADNLGFTNLWKEEGTIEDYFANQGGEKVSRVSKDVFNLEKTLGYDASSGAIVGADGKPALE
jgi:hypothetical protein